ncbi:TRAP transporter large permease [Oligella urethralis]|uniref:TRAP transporter large permease protein n=2 Tax=Oligella urethralis TaxID=90245 RepID=A0A2X1UIG7_9BURK|nr:TRAP transporter large permease [Oligella urethralis]MDK6201905.1 TRAP transporter large permease [Oligella urethralis]SPY07017.1 Neu5Ac permease [Oligella urethralis]SUA59995.1 Neu5Ac permease [Oligella urethralis]
MSVVLISFAILLFLILVLRVPIAFAMGGVGFFGFSVLNGLTWDNFDSFRWSVPLSLAANRIIDTAQDYGLSVIPLFILMGNLVTRSGLSNELYKACYAFLGHTKGGLAMATVLSCGGFSAVCGSSLATAATMSKVAMPAMRRYGYADSLATASIAAGGTLGILIPPSVMLIIYGLLTETSIRELFAAGLIPGLLGILFYLGAVRYTVWRNPSAGPVGEKMPWSERIRAFKGVRDITGLFVLIMGGIYLGIFTPTEAAGIGAGGAFLIALFRRTLTWANLFDTLVESARTSASLFTIIIGALIFSDFINRAGLPGMLLNLVQSLDVTPMVIILIIVLIYLLLGLVFESLSMLLLTIPVFYPVVQSLGFDLVWFGIVAVVVTEISLISPPVGMNVFVLSSVVKDVKTATIFKGILPFWGADMLRLAVIVFFAQISLWLPQFLY